MRKHFLDLSEVGTIEIDFILFVFRSGSPNKLTKKKKNKEEEKKDVGLFFRYQVLIPGRHITLWFLQFVMFYWN